MHGIQEFKKNSLKHVESQEKNPLPTKESLYSLDYLNCAWFQRGEIIVSFSLSVCYRSR